MSFLIPSWRSFRTLSSNSEAASASACCSYSLATLEIACCHPGAASFAVTERSEADVWRWAICNIEGLITHDGCESSQRSAKRTAEDMLRLEETQNTPTQAAEADQGECRF